MRRWSAAVRVSAPWPVASHRSLFLAQAAVPEAVVRELAAAKSTVLVQAWHPPCSRTTAPSIILPWSGRPGGNGRHV